MIRRLINAVRAAMRLGRCHELLVARDFDAVVRELAEIAEYKGQRFIQERVLLGNALFESGNKNRAKKVFRDVVPDIKRRKRLSDTEKKYLILYIQIHFDEYDEKKCLENL